MRKLELIEYEMPSIAEHISIPWMQTLLGRIIGRRVKKKLKRYEMRQQRKEFLKSITDTFKSSNPTV